ncbi:MAG TPA: glycosyltransferase family 2 protein [Longimicrobiales bacterium]|nr:glycosyltransferase family 2 protein [Longimicrobiales bacterium]
MTSILAALPWILVALTGLLRLRPRPRLRDYPPREDDDVPHVTVIIPARDEGVNIGPCVATIAASNYPDFDIVVVDDRSVDGTGDVVRALEQRAGGQVRLVQGERLPDGWIGKAWACWQGYRVATGPLILFTDADTRHDPELLPRAVAALRREDAALVSVLPRQVLLGFWERVIMPHVLLLITLRYFDLRRVNSTSNPRDVIANGQFMLVRRDAYDAVGGHEALRGEVVEDQRLAQRLVRAGRRIFVAHAEDYLDTRMYRSLSGIVEGWSKNLALGARAAVDPWLRPAIPWLAAAWVLLFWVGPPAALFMAVFGGWGWAWAWGALATAASLLYWVVGSMTLGVPRLYALTYPLGAIATAALFIRSAMRGQRVRWKGRDYTTGRV